MKSEVELREEYGRASRNTVRDAVKLLVSRGLVETRPGQGTFVVTKVVPFASKLNIDPESGGIEDEVYKLDVHAQGRLPEETTPRVEIQTPTGLVARQLKLADGSQVISRHQDHFRDRPPLRRSVRRHAPLPLPNRSPRSAPPRNRVPARCLHGPSPRLDP